MNNSDLQIDVSQVKVDSASTPAQNGYITSVGYIIVRYLWVVLLYIAIFFMIIGFIRFFLINPGRIEGVSMEPFLVDDNIFLVYRAGMLFSSPKRFSVVQILDPIDNKKIVKRIIGLPGEHVTIKRGGVYISNDLHSEDRRLDESLYLSTDVYTKVFGTSGAQVFIVPENHFFVMGDNRGHSSDSRAYGAIHRSVILGTVVKKYISAN